MGSAEKDTSAGRGRPVGLSTCLDGSEPVAARKQARASQRANQTVMAKHKRKCPALQFIAKDKQNRIAELCLMRTESTQAVQDEWATRAPMLSCKVNEEACNFCRQITGGRSTTQLAAAIGRKMSASASHALQFRASVGKKRSKTCALKVLEKVCLKSDRALETSIVAYVAME